MQRLSGTGRLHWRIQSKLISRHYRSDRKHYWQVMRLARRLDTAFKVIL